MGQLAAVLVVRSANGERELGDGTLEGTQVLAEDALKLVHAEHRLARTSLHEILVGVVGCGVVDEVLAQDRRQEVGEEGSLEDATPSHEDEDDLVDHLQRFPCHHHRHKPLLEEIAELLLGVMIVRLVDDVDGVGELVDVVGIAFLFPLRQLFEIVHERVERLAEVAVDDVVERLAGHLHAVLVHLQPERVLDVVIYQSPVWVLARQHHEASQLIGSRHQVVLHLVVHREPLLDGVGRGAEGGLLALSPEVPLTKLLGVLVARLHHGSRVAIAASKLVDGIGERLFLGDAIEDADLGELYDILVVSPRLKLVAPLVEQVLDGLCRLLDGRSRGVHALHLGSHLLRLSLLHHLGVPGLVGLSGVEHLEIVGTEAERHGILAEEGIGVVGKTRDPGDVGASLVGFASQQMSEVVHRLVDHHVEEFQHGHVLVLYRRVGAEDAESLAADGDVGGEDVLILSEKVHALLDFLLRLVVEVEHEEVGRSHEVGELLAIPIHDGGDGDARRHRFVLIGETLADGEALAIGLGDDLQSLVLADEVFQVLPTSELMAFRGVKRLEVGGHDRCFVFSG